MARVNSPFTAADHLARRRLVSASKAPAIMRGGEDLFAQWERDTGRAESDDLSRVFPVMMGLASEALNLDFFEYATGHAVTREGEHCVHPTVPYLTCTLDGFVAGIGPVQCKHVNAFSKIDDVLAKYQWQVIAECVVTGSDRGFLSVIIGTNAPEIIEIHADVIDQAEWMQAAACYHRCVIDNVPPEGFAAKEAATPVTEFRKVDMSPSNAWAEHAGIWLKNRDGAKAFDAAVKEIKALVEADVSEATGHGIKVSRNKAGSLSIKESK